MAPAIYPTERYVDQYVSPLGKKTVDFDEIVASRACGGETKLSWWNREYGSRLGWLASEVIGADSELVTPFGSRRITYCDHTASGRCLWFIEEYLATQVLPFYGNTHTEDSYVGVHTSELVKEANKYIKRCVGAGSNVSLLFCGSGTTGAIKRLQEVMGISASPPLRHRLLESISGDERWVIFLGPYEHHSNLLSWKQTVAEVVVIGLDDSGKLDLCALEAALQSPDISSRPKLGSFSACSNITGVRTDTRAVATLLHRYGAYACFDFACSGPYEDIDMRTGEEDGYDAVFLSTHKFLGGPGSPGILLVRDALYSLKGGAPSTSGGGTVLYVSGYDDQDVLYNEHVEEREDAGTPPIVQKIRAALAFAVKSYASHDLIRQKEAQMWKRASSKLTSNPRIRVLGEKNDANQPIFSFLIYPAVGDIDGKHLHCHFTSRLLNDLFGIQSRGGCSCAGPYAHRLLGISGKQQKSIRAAIEKGYEGLRPGFTRISFAYYTTYMEMEFVLHALDFVAEMGHRFLPLYHFDWRAGTWDYIHDHGALERFVWPLIQPLEHCRAMVGAAIKRFYEGISVFDSCGILSLANTEKFMFANYLREARKIAEALQDFPAQKRSLPPDVDPELLTFMV